MRSAPAGATCWREQARAGVAVRLLVDALGSKNCKSRFWRPLIEAGGEVRLFNPPRLLKLRASLLNFRTHRKIVVIDGARRLHRRHQRHRGQLRRHPASGSAWRDTHLAIDGPAALDLQMIFLEDWLYAGTGQRPRTRHGRSC